MIKSGHTIFYIAQKITSNKSLFLVLRYELYIVGVTLVEDNRKNGSMIYGSWSVISLY